MNNGYNFFPVGYPQYQYPYQQFPQQQYQQPVPQQQSAQPTPQPQYHPITWVDNEDALKSITLAPGTSGEFWDKSKDVIYIKSCDTAGRETIEYYDVKERPKYQPAPDMSSYVPKSDFSLLVQEVNKIKQMVEAHKNEDDLREDASGFRFSNTGEQPTDRSIQIRG